MKESIYCDEKLTVDPSLRCTNKATFALVYTDPGDKSKLRYACTAHVGKSAKWVSKHRNPSQNSMGLINLEEYP